MRRSFRRWIRKRFTPAFQQKSVLNEHGKDIEAGKWGDGAYCGVLGTGKAYKQKAGEMETVDKRTNDEPIALSSSHSMQVSLDALKHGKAGLDKRRKGMLNRVPKQGDDADFAIGILNIKDLAYLTAATGDEFAILRGKDKEIYCGMVRLLNVMCL